MKDGMNLPVIWEEVTSPDAEQRLATAFTMLFSTMPTFDFKNDGLDSQK
jgi:hypothetical protein